MKKLAHKTLKEVNDGSQNESFVVEFIKMFEKRVTTSNYGK